MTLKLIWQQLRDADDWQSAFQPLPQHSLAAVKQRYRTLARLVHPDHHPTEQALAVATFQRLQAWYERAQQTLEAPTMSDPFELTSRTGHYRSSGQGHRGELCDLYWATRQGSGTTSPVLLKLVRQASNNDLLRAEGSTLRLLAQELQGEPLRAHFPTLLDQVQIRDLDGETRMVNILAQEQANLALARVHHGYPAGLDPADAAWIYKRLLAALAITHDLGLVHGAVTLDHLLIRPRDHNGLLVDWCYSVPCGGVIKAVSPRYRADYPPEVLAKQPASPATDLYMAAKVMVRLLGGDPATNALPATVPKAIGAFLQSCLIAAPHRRPDSAWELFTEFDALLQRCYGPPKFRPFPPLARAE